MSIIAMFTLESSTNAVLRTQNLFLDNIGPIHAHPDYAEALALSTIEAALLLVSFPDN